MQTKKFNAAAAHASKGQDGKDVWWEHSDLINPKLAIWSVAYSLKRSMDVHLKGDPKRAKAGDVGSWWTGKVSWKQAQRARHKQQAKFEAGELKKAPRKLSGQMRDKYYRNHKLKGTHNHQTRGMKITDWKNEDVSDWLKEGDDAFPTKETMVPAKGK